ncbi:MAG: HD domain-containing protein [Kiritimatiellae bacterium]|nr:HD domain-containing protein [Kiritimatiellia bacterium]
MQYKSSPATDALSRHPAPPLVAALIEANRLKTLFRQGWLRAGVDPAHCESVADHSFGVAILSLFLADAHFPALDRTKILLLALLHDFGEIYAGDIVPGKMSLADKHDLERAAVERVFAKLPNGAEYIALWQEYEDQSSPEAVLVKQVDRLEMGVQAVAYENTLAPIDLSDFLQSTRDALSAPPLLDFFSGLLPLRPGAPG